MAELITSVVIKPEGTERLLAIAAAARTLCENVTPVGPFQVPAVDLCDLIVLRQALGMSKS